MILFAYNFKHKKTQDFIFHCLYHKINIDCIIAADPVTLTIPKSVIRTKVRHQGMFHPKDIAKSFDIPYIVAPHNSEETWNVLKEIEPKIGMIAGARILKKEIIDIFSRGIINFHPGLIPEVRGLDAMLWSIQNKIPLGITSHIIDQRIDAGKILEIKKIMIFKDDTLVDLSERLYEMQLEMINTSFTKLQKGTFEKINIADSGYNRKMPPEMERTIKHKLNDYLKYWGT